jgi:hypothetical protein
MRITRESVGYRSKGTLNTHAEFVLLLFSATQHLMAGRSIAPTGFLIK